MSNVRARIIDAAQQAANNAPERHLTFDYSYLAAASTALVIAKEQAVTLMMIALGAGERSRAAAYEDVVRHLDRLLADLLVERPPRQESEQKELGMNLHQPIPDMAGTKPRPIKEQEAQSVAGVQPPAEFARQSDAATSHTPNTTTLPSGGVHRNDCAYLASEGYYDCDCQQETSAQLEHEVHVLRGSVEYFSGGYLAMKERVDVLRSALEALVAMYGPSTEYDYLAREAWQRAEAALKAQTSAAFPDGSE